MTSKLTRERVFALIAEHSYDSALVDALEHLLAAMDSEPVAYIFKHPAGRLFWALTDESNKGQSDVMPVYAEPQPAPAFPDFDNVLESLDYEVRCNAWESEHVMQACQTTYDACRAAMLQELQKVQELKQPAGVTKMCRCCTPNLRRNPIAARRKTTFLRSKTATLQRKARDGFR